MVYLPGRTIGKTNLPAASVLVGVVVFRSGLSSITAASGTTAPAGSISVPVIDPAVVCAPIHCGNETIVRQATTMTIAAHFSDWKPLESFFISPPSFLSVVLQDQAL